MKLKYEAEKSGRLKRLGFMGVTSYDQSLWWCRELGWTKEPKTCWSNYAPCRSVKAFRRMLKKCPKGVEFTLVSRYMGYSVSGVNK